jgi:16S rRNA (cytidine1402-2'-O)-methyltransferase
VGILYLVATPIGNLADISVRALETLRTVQLIAAEDTRQTSKLLKHYNIQTQLTSYFEHNKLRKLSFLLDALSAGDVALVSDAGTPALNDPGYELVRAALEAGHTICPIPGPTAPVTALIASGLPTDRFLYMGYLPRKSAERCRLLDEVEKLPYTLIFLEVPHRLLDSLEDILNTLGDRQIAIARELTKIHEEIIRGSISEGIKYFSENSPRGEFTLVISGWAAKETIEWSENYLRSVLEEGLASDLSPARLASQIAVKSGKSRRDVYRLIAQLQNESRVSNK